MIQKEPKALLISHSLSIVTTKCNSEKWKVLQSYLPVVVFGMCVELVEYGKKAVEQT